MTNPRSVWAIALWATVLWAATATIGPAKGTLLVVGGGALGPDITAEFLRLAGGPEAPIVVIPTAGEEETFDVANSFLREARNVTVLHTRDRQQADSPEFVAPLHRARAVWIPGGRQWRLVDSYLHTRTQRELQGVLDRGGVIAGTSAGATILGSYLVRGAREGNTIMMAKGYEEGFGFLKHVAVDQHLLTRKREADMLPVIQAHPDLLGIGIDEDTAIEVQGDEFRVLGKSKVAVYDPEYHPAQGEKAYYFLSAGDHFDLKGRHKQ